MNTPTMTKEYVRMYNYIKLPVTTTAIQEVTSIKQVLLVN